MGIWPSGLRRWRYYEEAGVHVMVVFTHDCDGLCPTDVRMTSEKPVLGWLILCVNFCENVQHSGPNSLQHATATFKTSVGTSP